MYVPRPSSDSALTTPEPDLTLHQRLQETVEDNVQARQGRGDRTLVCVHRHDVYRRIRSRPAAVHRVCRDPVSGILMVCRRDGSLADDRYSLSYIPYARSVSDLVSVQSRRELTIQLVKSWVGWK
jgi:hypothetical protein